MTPEDEYVELLDDRTLEELSQFHEDLELHKIEQEVEEELYGTKAKD